MNFQVLDLPYRLKKPTKIHANEKLPSSIPKALQNQNWKNAMLSDYNVLLHNGTWELVPYQSHCKIVDSKWAFKIKYNSDGIVSRFKAILMAKRFHQTPRIDYF